METEIVGKGTKLYTGDELTLVFRDEDQGFLDFWDSDPFEFAQEVVAGLQGQTIDLGENGEALLLVLDAYAKVDEEGTPLAFVRARIQDLRPPVEREEELQAGLGATLQIAIGLAVLAAGYFLIHPVLVEVRRTVRGFTDEEREDNAADAVVSYVGPLVVGAIVLGVAWVLLKRKL